MPTISYTHWLVRLTKHFFGPQFADERVRLIVTHEMLDQTFPDLGGTENFLSAVRSGPEWIRTDTALSERGLMLLSMWKHRSHRSSEYPSELDRLKDAPPYLPVLCLLCLAWTEDQPNLQPHDFYGRLSALYPDHGLNHRLGDWEPLWRGLQQWTVSLDKKWGHFVVEVLGDMNHVGIPKSQVILTPCKVDRLPELFTKCSLQPVRLAPEIIRSVFSANAGATRAILGKSLYGAIEANTPLGQSSLVLLGDYLENWDGLPAANQIEPGASTVRKSSQNLSVVLKLNEESPRWTVAFGLRDFAAARGLQCAGQGWSFASVDTGLVVLQDIHGCEVTPTGIARDWTDGVTLKANWQADLADVDPFRLVLPQERGVRVFDEVWVDQCLVEGTTLPTSGGLFV